MEKEFTRPDVIIHPDYKVRFRKNELVDESLHECWYDHNTGSLFNWLLWFCTYKPDKRVNKIDEKVLCSYQHSNNDLSLVNLMI